MSLLTNLDPSSTFRKKEQQQVISEGEQTDSDASSIDYDHTHRRLKSRHVQLIGIGGTIGTGLYVGIGLGLLKGGPASLLLGFAIWSTVMICISNSLAEMVCYLPISSPFVRFAGRYVDEAFGVAAGYNYFIFEALLVPFEIVASTFILSYWTPTTYVNPGVIIAAIIIIFGLNNFFAVKWYGEVEFWMALGKVVLAVGLILFTFITMLGGNPLHERFGFKYWTNPGSFAEYYTTGSLGQFLGVLACIIQASFTIAGPDYVSMAAGETQNPRVVLPKAFRSVFYRLTAFFVLGALSVGILVPYNDKDLLDAFTTNKPGAASSPYVIAMNRLHIPFLPDLLNALILTSAVSAGNSYVFCASRSLYGLALEGKAPSLFRKTNRSGVPIYCVSLVLMVALLAFLELSDSTATVLGWFINFITVAQLINFSVCNFTYLRFYNACKVQHFDRSILPFVSYGQPYTTYYALAMTLTFMIVGGYRVFLPGYWSSATFIFAYGMIFLFIIIFVIWKVFKKTTWKASKDIDLLQDKNIIDDYEIKYMSKHLRR